MIVTPTVLILGAGASYPYHYPLGGELVRRIIAETQPNGGILAKVFGVHRVGWVEALHIRAVGEELGPGAVDLPQCVRLPLLGE